MQDNGLVTTEQPKTPRPARPRFRPERIPSELQHLARWVCWSYVWSPAKKKWDKPPRQVDGTFASSTDPATWCEFDRAIRCVRDNVPRFDGVGHVLIGDGLTAIDLDRCVSSAGVSAVREGDLAGIARWAREIVIDLNSYTELSPSACGIRIFVRASLPSGRGNRKGLFEAYDHARYVTVTGNHIAGMPRHIEERQTALDRVVARMLPDVLRTSLRDAMMPRLPDDDALLDKARNARNGHRFAALFERGELRAFGGDHSRADLALCSMLAFWCGADRLQIDRLFRRSALYRAKWDERHSRTGQTYGEMTVRRSLTIR